MLKSEGSSKGTPDLQVSQGRGPLLQLRHERDPLVLGFRRRFVDHELDVGLRPLGGRGPSGVPPELRSLCAGQVSVGPNATTLDGPFSADNI